MAKSDLIFIALLIVVISVAAIKDARCPDYTSIYDHAVHLPHDKNCSKYYVCEHDHSIIENKCPPELEFNPKLSVCDFVGACELAPLQPLSGDNETESYDDSVNVFIDNKCPLDDDPMNPTLLPNPNDCSSFFICDAGIPVETKCPPNLYWNDDQKYCDYLTNVNCSNNP